MPLTRCPTCPAYNVLSMPRRLSRREFAQESMLGSMTKLVSSKLHCSILPLHLKDEATIWRMALTCDAGRAKPWLIPDFRQRQRVRHRSVHGTHGDPIFCLSTSSDPAHTCQWLGCPVPALRLRIGQVGQLLGTVTSKALH